MSRNGPASRVRFWEAQKRECPLCEKPIVDPLDTDDCNIDHKNPKAHDGTDARSNLQLTHVACNRKKGCGCPIGDRYHTYSVMVQAIWRKQGFKCAVCLKPLAPSGIINREITQLIDDYVAHKPCVDQKFQEEGGS